MKHVLRFTLFMAVSVGLLFTSIAASSQQQTPPIQPTLTAVFTQGLDPAFVDQLKDPDHPIYENRVEARQFGSKLIRENRDNPLAYLAYGYISLNLQDEPLAIRNFTKVIALDPENAAGYYELGHIHFMQYRDEEAIAEFTRVIELNPQHADAYYHRGAAYVETNHHEDGIADFTQAIEINPDYAHAYFWRGMTYLENDQIQVAEEDFLKSIQLYTDYLADHPDDTNSINNRGIAYYVLEAYDDALADFSHIIDLEPDNLYGLYNRGLVYTRTDEMEKAFADYRHATDFELKTFGTVAPPAIRDLDDAVKEEPENPTAYLFRGYLHYRSGTLDSARADWEQVEALGGTFPLEIQALWDELKEEE